MRKIIHIDMDAFFASIEQRDFPHLRGIPLAVGNGGERGVVAAASYEARRYGVHSAMSSRAALARCPQLVFTPARFEVYREVSRTIMDIFHEYTDKDEPLSLDEAYLDVTVNHRNMPSATLIAREIKQRIRRETGLTASAGVSVNKFLAKVASDYDKPDGLKVVTDREAEEFVASLRIEQFWGVGRVTADKMHRLGIHTGADLRARSEAELIHRFGKVGHLYYLNARGIDYREVVSERIRKSVGSEVTFASDIDDRQELLRQLAVVGEEVWRRAGRRDFYGRTVTLKIKFADFRQITRSRTAEGFITEYNRFRDMASELFDAVDLQGEQVRLIGLSVSNPADIESPEYRQLEIEFPEE